MTTDETGVRSDPIRIRWSFDYSGGHMAGDATVHPADWGMASVEERNLLVRQEVGDAVLKALDVDWTITNARLSDPNY